MTEKSRRVRRRPRLVGVLPCVHVRGAHQSRTQQTAEGAYLVAERRHRFGPRGDKAVADGQMSADVFASEHVELSGPNPSQGEALAGLMGRALMRMTGAG